MRFRVLNLINYDFQNPDLVKSGREFAGKLLKKSLPWKNLSLQITGLSARIGISTFWKAFAKEIKTQAPDLWPVIKNIEWVCDHEFQEKNIATWLS